MLWLLPEAPRLSSRRRTPWNRRVSWPHRARARKRRGGKFTHRCARTRRVPSFRPILILKAAPSDVSNSCSSLHPPEPAPRHGPDAPLLPASASTWRLRWINGQTGSACDALSVKKRRKGPAANILQKADRETAGQGITWMYSGLHADWLGRASVTTNHSAPKRYTACLIATTHRE